MLIYQFQYNNINACHCYKQLGAPLPSSGALGETLGGGTLGGEKEIKGERETRAMGDKLIAQAMPDQTKEFSNYVKSKMPAALRNADNIALLSRKLLDKGYDKRTIIKIETAEQDGAYFVKITLKPFSIN